MKFRVEWVMKGCFTSISTQFWVISGQQPPKVMKRRMIVFSDIH